jgi:hypothetical protein
VISLDNLSAGGDGGDGGSGGDGARAGDASHISNGPPGGGGGPGGNGGNTGEPGAGGDAGNANGAGYTGGRGGEAGAGGAKGGRGGFGGIGGSLYLYGQQLTNQAIVNLSGGTRGKGGAGIEAMFAKGGKGGAPNGQNGLDSPEFAKGADGVDGVPGSIYFWNTWVLPGSRFVGTWIKADGAGSFQPNSSSGGGGIQISATNQPVTLSSPVNTASDRPLEITLKYRWLTTAGSLDLTLTGVQLLHLDAPGTATGQFAETRVIVSEGALLNQGTQTLAVQLNPGPAAQIEITSLTITPLSEVLLISLSPTNAAQVDLSWFGNSNTTYSLQISTLAPGSIWTNLGPSLPGQGAWITVPQPISLQPSGAFYRFHIESTVQNP